jgi:hypothetical protein
MTNLVTTSTLVMADAALALNIAVGQEGVMGRAIGLGSLTLLDVTVLPQTGKDTLDYLGVLRGRSAAKNIKVNPEPVVNLLVDRVILGAQCGRVHSLRKRFCLSRRAIFIRATDEDSWQVACPAETGKHIGRLKHGSRSVSERV